MLQFFWFEACSHIGDYNSKRETWSERKCLRGGTGKRAYERRQAHTPSWTGYKRLDLNQVVLFVLANEMSAEMV